MHKPSVGSLKLDIEVERWPLAKPFRISGRVWEQLEVILVRLEKDGAIGRGEAAGVYYKDDVPRSMVQEIEAVRGVIENGIDQPSLSALLRSSGARNALDCALLDLNAKLARTPVWQMAGLRKPRPLMTTFTCGADKPEAMARTALAHVGAKALKLKLTGEPVDAERVFAVREAMPDAWIGIDANQGFTRRFLEDLMPVLEQSKVALIEQPFPVGQESMLENVNWPIPIAADESAQTARDIPSLLGRFDIVNIKLDKCGGLSEALTMARAARERGLGVMVGNMIGTSLAMAPAFLLGELCDVVDLDGPLLLQNDRLYPVAYRDGNVFCTERIWGGVAS